MSVVWYTGANNLQTGNGSLSSADAQFLQMWLDQGNKRLLIFAPPYLVQDLEPFPLWGETPTNQFLSLYIGAQGCDQNPQQLFSGQNFVASGVEGTPFGLDGGEVFQVTPKADPRHGLGFINPGARWRHCDVPSPLPPTSWGCPEAPQPLPCTVINSKAGQAGTSIVAFVGIPIEDIQALDAGSSASFFTALEQSLP